MKLSTKVSGGKVKDGVKVPRSGLMGQSMKDSISKESSRVEVNLPGLKGPVTKESLPTAC